MKKKYRLVYLKGMPPEECYERKVCVCVCTCEDEERKGVVESDDYIQPGL